MSVQDPVFFAERLKVTMQALGWRGEGRFLPLQDDISSVAYWYQTLPDGPFPQIPARNDRETIQQGGLKWIAGWELFGNVAWRDAWFMVA
ncbi:MAG: DUF2961 domain-containing protein [Planctomycetes bacterium]|nr:DUF2961 domain-containing protein [Planctomycetota bacterium]